MTELKIIERTNDGLIEVLSQNMHGGTEESHGKQES
jgi:hypothetical protein